MSQDVSSDVRLSMTRNARAWRAGMVTTGAVFHPSESAALYRVSPAGAPAHAGLGPIPTGCQVPDPVSARRPVAESPDTTKEEHGKTDQLLLKAKKQYQAAVRGEARLRQDMEDDRRFRFCIGVPPSSNGWLCVLRHQRTPAARQRRGESDGRGCNGTRATRTPCVARMASLA